MEGVEGGRGEKERRKRNQDGWARERDEESRIVGEREREREREGEDVSSNNVSLCVGLWGERGRGRVSVKQQCITFRIPS